MAATSPQTLFDDAQCISCLGAVGRAQMLRIALLADALTNLGISMTTQELIDEGQCYLCIPGVSLADAVELALLSEISQNITGGGGGGGSANQTGHGTPLNVVTPNAAYVWYRDIDTDNYWWANGLTSADWVAAI